jgi:hypothetical protein
MRSKFRMENAKGRDHFGRRRLDELYYKKFWEDVIAYLSLMRHGPYRKRCVQQLFYCWACIHCRGDVSIEPLPSNDKGITYRHTDCWEEEFMMGLSAMVYIRRFIKIGSGIQKLMRMGYTDTQKEPTFIFFFQISKVGKNLLWRNRE